MNRPQISFLLWDERQHAVISDGVDDGVGDAAWICLRISFFKVEALKQPGGQILGSLSCLEASQRGQKIYFLQEAANHRLAEQKKQF